MTRDDRDRPRSTPPTSREDLRAELAWLRRTLAGALLDEPRAGLVEQEGARSGTRAERAAADGLQ